MTAYLTTSDRVIDLAVEIINPLVMRAMQLPGPARAQFLAQQNGTVAGVFYVPWAAPDFLEAERWFAPRPDVVTAALQYVLAGGVWNANLLGDGALWGDSFNQVQSRTLNGRPGVVLLQPLIAVPRPSRAQGAGITATTDRPYKVPYVLIGTINVFPGQAIQGLGRLGASGDLGPARPTSVARQMPFIRRPMVVGSGFGPMDANNAGAIFTLRTESRLESLSLSTIGGAIQTPAILIPGAQRVTIRDVDISEQLTRPLRIASGSRDILIERLHCASGSISVEDDTEDVTFWTCPLAARLDLRGTNHAMWSGIIEPTVRQALPEVEVRGVGCSIYANRVEGAVAGTVAPALRAGLVGIRVRDAADFTEIATSHHSHEGFPVLVSRDAGAGLIRTLPFPSGFSANNVNRLNMQPMLDVGLTNFLGDSTLHSLGETVDDPILAPNSPWKADQVSSVRWIRPGRALAHAVRVRPRGRGGRTATLSQEFRASPRDGIESVANRTFAGGVWIRQALNTRARLVLRSFERAVMSNTTSVLGQWAFLSAVIHTEGGARAIRWSLQLESEGGGEIDVSEPILVRGPWIPPFRPRPLREGGGAIYGPAIAIQGTGQFDLRARVRNGRWETTSARVGSVAEVHEVEVRALGAAQTLASIAVTRGTELIAVCSPDEKGPVAPDQLGFTIEPGDGIEFRDLPKPSPGAVLIGQLMVRRQL